MRLRSVLIPAAIATAAGGVAVTAVSVLAVRRLAGAVLQRRVSDLHDQVVLITGGSRGLGFALAREFAHAGARVAICARDQHELEEAERRLKPHAHDVAAFTCDVTRQEEVNQLVERVLERFGRIDVLINNAGQMHISPIETLDRADFEHAMNTMFWGPLDLTLAVLPHMRRKHHGHIVNITSLGGHVAVPRLLPYCCAKFALEAFSEGLTSELHRSGIRVLTVSPGLMRTGSYLQAQFKGAAAQEFTWFGLAGNLPGFSVAADYAARQVRSAVESGRASCTISWPAKLLVRLHALFPDTTRTVLTGFHEHLLPRPGASKTFVAGRTLDEKLDDKFRGMFRLFTKLGRAAASELNQHSEARTA